LSDCATRAWISPAYCGGDSFSNSMLRLERRRKEKGSHSPSGIFILISLLSTSVTGRRQIERRSASEPLMTICVTSSIVCAGHHGGTTEGAAPGSVIGQQARGQSLG